MTENYYFLSALNWPVERSHGQGLASRGIPGPRKWEGKMKHVCGQLHKYMKLYRPIIINILCM